MLLHWHLRFICVIVVLGENTVKFIRHICITFVQLIKFSKLFLNEMQLFSKRTDLIILILNQNSLASFGSFCSPFSSCWVSVNNFYLRVTYFGYGFGDHIVCCDKHTFSIIFLWQPWPRIESVILHLPGLVVDAWMLFTFYITLSFSYHPTKINWRIIKNVFWASFRCAFGC